MPIRISLAVEGPLDEVVLRQLLTQSGRQFQVAACYGKRGKAHLRENAARLNYAAAHSAFVLLTDLDQDACAPGLVAHWLPQGPSRNMLVRVAVREVEAWLLADRTRLAAFLGIPVARITQRPDDVDDPKLLMVDLARRSEKRKIREDLVPGPGSTSQVGRGYVGRLSQFVALWRADEAARSHSPSLDRAVRAIEGFSPLLHTEAPAS